MKQHFLQSEAWENFQHALGNETIRQSGDDWSYLAIVEHSAGLTRLYCPYGPTFESYAALDAALASLKTEAEKVSAAFVRVQPFGAILDNSETQPHGMKPINYSQPVATRVIDLSPSLDDLVARMSQSKRSVVRNYESKGLTYRTSTDAGDIEKLLPLLHDIADRNHISLHSDNYLRKQASALLPDNGSLHFMELNGNPVSGALLFEDEQTCYYAHAGTEAEHYKLQANTALVGAMISYAKSKGKQWFDLYGIAPTEDPKHPWAGISSFKASFGGEVVCYNETYDIPLKKLTYFAYSVLRSLEQTRGE